MIIKKGNKKISFFDIIIDGIDFYIGKYTAL